MGIQLFAKVRQHDLFCVNDTTLKTKVVINKRDKTYAYVKFKGRHLGRKVFSQVEVDYLTPQNIDTAVVAVGNSLKSCLELSISGLL